MVLRAELKLLKPSMGLIRFLMNLWSCSIRLFRYLFCRIFIGFSRFLLTLTSANLFDPLLSILIFSGTPLLFIDLLKKSLCCLHIAFCSQKEINGVTVGIDCPVKIYPFSRDFYICLIHTPTSIYGLLLFSYLSLDKS